MINKSGLYTILMNCGVSLQRCEPQKGKALGCDWLSAETSRIQQIQHFRTSVRVLQLRSAWRRLTFDSPHSCSVSIWSSNKTACPLNYTTTVNNWANSLLPAGGWYFWQSPHSCSVSIWSSNKTVCPLNYTTTVNNWASSLLPAGDWYFWQSPHSCSVSIWSSNKTVCPLNYTTTAFPKSYIFDIFFYQSPCSQSSCPLQLQQLCVLNY